MNTDSKPLFHARPRHLLRMFLLLAVSVAGALCKPAVAQQTEATTQVEAHRREALRATILQLRTAQSDLEALQLVKNEIEKERDALKQQLAAVAKQAAADRASAEKNASALNESIKSKDAEIEKLAGLGATWKKALEDKTELARRLDAERSRLEIANSELERRASEREVQNVALVRIAQEILRRFERFGLGDALVAKEPFTGLKRAELKSLVQDYADKILDQKATPAAASGAGAQQVSKR